MLKGVKVEGFRAEGLGFLGLVFRVRVSVWGLQVSGL